MAIALSALYRYPLKSGAAEALTQCELGDAGLVHDREWMVATQDGEMVTGRKHPQLVRVQARASADGLTLSAPGMATLILPWPAAVEEHAATVWQQSFAAQRFSAEADGWISHFLGADVRLLWTGRATQRRHHRHNVPLSFADGYPLLLTSTSSLAALEAESGASWEMLRFRPNLVITGSDAFAEDGWKAIEVGGIRFDVVKPCERCVFITVDPLTGEKHPKQEPLKTIARWRKKDFGVTFGQNVIARGQGTLEVGMPVTLVE
ncbi:MOSC domain-containing protein [Chitinibacteraceae bacterium HSL-7]